MMFHTMKTGGKWSDVVRLEWMSSTRARENDVEYKDGVVGC